MKYRYLSVSCRDCANRWDKRADSIKRWSGRCNPCAQKATARDPSVKQRKSTAARAQLIRQGGIPNSHRFTTENIGGDKHWNWKGGKYRERIALYSSAAYKEWRRSVFVRDDFTCQTCRERGGYLHAHHVIPVSVDRSKALDLSNGLTLCATCHADHHSSARQRRTDGTFAGAAA